MLEYVSSSLVYSQPSPFGKPAWLKILCASIGLHLLVLYALWLGSTWLAGEVSRTDTVAPTITVLLADEAPLVLPSQLGLANEPLAESAVVTKPSKTADLAKVIPVTKPVFLTVPFVSPVIVPVIAPVSPAKTPLPKVVLDTSSASSTPTALASSAATPVSAQAAQVLPATSMKSSSLSSGSAPDTSALNNTASVSTTAVPVSVQTAPKYVLPSTRASYLNNSAPVMPTMSRRLGEYGTVRLSVLVGADGAAQKTQLHASSGYDRLDQAALQAVAQWRFAPGTRDGIAEAMWHVVPIEFSQ